MLEEIYDEIIEKLDRIVSAQRGLLDLSRQKQALIVKNDADAVNEIVKREWELIGQAAEAETERGQLVDELSGLFSMSADELSLSEIASRADGRRAELLLERGEALLDIACDLRDVNEMNRQLLDLHFQYID